MPVERRYEHIEENLEARAAASGNWYDGLLVEIVIRLGRPYYPPNAHHRTEFSLSYKCRAWLGRPKRGSWLIPTGGGGAIGGHTS